MTEENQLVLPAAFGYPKGKMNRKIRRLAGLLAILTAGLLPPALAARRNIVLALDKKEIREMTSSGLILAFQIEVANASSNAYALTEYDYRVVVDGSDLFAWRTALETPITVAPEGKALIALPIKIAYADVFKTIPTAEGKTRLNGYATGLMIFTDARKRQEKVPFAFSGDFPVFKDVKVAVRPVALKVLTIGGTEFGFSFALTNPNDFEIVPGNLDYSLAFDGRTAVRGAIEGDNRLGPGGEKTFRLPVMLDFFEVGKEFHAILDKPAAACRLAVESTADSIWGPIRLSYTKETQVELKRGE